jgi:hypothetical protein
MLASGASFGYVPGMKLPMNRAGYEAIDVPLLARVGVKPNANVFKDMINLLLWIIQLSPADTRQKKQFPLWIGMSA